MEFKLRSEKNLSWVFTICQILAILRLTTGVGVNLGLCPEKVFQCQCGSDPNVKVGLPVKQCTYFYRWEPYCKPCDKLKENDACSKYRTCKLCETNRCTACPFNRFGQWCENDCRCQNGADCDINGFCQCVNGYEGRFCETDTGCSPPTITPPLKGTMVPPNKPLFVEYQCPPTHELTGVSRVSCLPTKEWNHPPPTCAMRCDIPDSIQNGMISTTRKPVLSGDAVQFSCSQGYSLFGSTSANCGTDGKIDRDLPVCVKVSECSEPLKVLKSSREISYSVPQVTDRYFNETVIKYQCEKDYFMFGKSEITCLFSGLWNLLPPTCVKVPESVVTCDTTAAEILDDNGVTVSVQCPPGCAMTNHPVYGTVIYHYRSSICRAALHGGKITNNGGIVFLTNSGHYSDFLSSSLNGITSSAKPEAGISFRFTHSPDKNYFSQNVTKSSEAENDCPTGWNAINGYCYIYVEKAKAFEMSKSTCSNLGTRLPNLKDSAFLSSVQGILNKTKGLHMSWLLSKRNANYTDPIIVWKGKDVFSNEDNQLISEFDHALDHHDSPSGHCTVIESRESFLVWKIRKCDEPAPFFCVHNPKDYVEENCKDPGPLQNGYAEFEGEMKGFQKGAVIKYQCAELHYLSGDATSVCSENATWTNPKPRCIKLSTCSDPQIPKYGSMKILPPENLSQQKRGGIVRSRIARPFHLRTRLFPSTNGTLKNNRTKRMTNETFVSVTTISPTTTTSEELRNITREPSTNNSESNSGNKSSNTSGHPKVINPPILGRGIRVGLSSNNVSNERVKPNGLSYKPTSSDFFFNQNNDSQAVDNVILPEGHYRVGTRVSYACESRYYDIIGSQSRRCQSDGTWSGRGVTCVPVCGRSDSPKTPFITNGNATEVGQWPWQVGISQFLKEYDQWFLLCGGALISESWVLTAAHCLTSPTGQILPLTNFKFQFGKYHRNNELDDDMVEEREAKEIHVHPDFDPTLYDADIALVLLDIPVTLTSRVQPICLPTDRSTRINIVDARKGVVTGWGLNEDDEYSETLRQAVMPVVRHEICEKGYETAGLPLTVSENMFCAGYEQGSTDSCNGDSGGPMVFVDDSAKGRRWILEGIVSWGSPTGCGNPQQYGGFTLVHKFLPWIQQFI